MAEVTPEAERKAFREGRAAGEGGEGNEASAELPECHSRYNTYFLLTSPHKMPKAIRIMRKSRLYE